jgi:hypothetical protein
MKLFIQMAEFNKKFNFLNLNKNDINWYNSSGVNSL